MLLQALVLSGHDHDQCTVTHMYNKGQATEVNVISFCIDAILSISYLTIVAVDS